MNNNQGLNPGQISNNSGMTPVNSVPPQNQQTQILNQANNNQVNQPVLGSTNQNNFFNQNMQANTGVNLDNMVHNDATINDLNVDGT